MAYPLTPTPSLTNAEWAKFTRELEANQHRRISKEKKEYMEDLVRRVLANSNLK